MGRQQVSYTRPSPEPEAKGLMLGTSDFKSTCQYLWLIVKYFNTAPGCSKADGVKAGKGSQACHSGPGHQAQVCGFYLWRALEGFCVGTELARVGSGSSTRSGSLER